ncbi:Opie2a pol protein [Gryllus bimaculatus]|nr:Opie2a pol protein [Gryllus bimaculatus]
MFAITWFREVVESGLLKLEHLASVDMPADIFTKALTRSKHEKCVELLELVNVKGSGGYCLEGKCWGYRQGHKIPSGDRLSICRAID